MRIPLRSAAALAFALSLPFAAAADERSEAAAADLLHRVLEKERPQDKALLDAVQGKDVVVVAGSMDHIENVLVAARIKHTVIAPEQVADYALKSSMILMVNCPGTMPDASVHRIERFVRAGGLLYTTDWALANVVQKAFPRTIAHNGNSTGDHVVPVKVVQKDDNLMSQMLLRKGADPQWWLEGGSYPIRILDEKRVEVLARSDTMGKRYGGSPVVVRFRHEDGEVIHVVSHFYRQIGTRGPAVAAAKATVDGVSEEAVKDWKKSAGAQAATIGDVESSYAFQKMTTNLVTGKQKRNVELDKLYRYESASGGGISLQAAPTGGASAGTVPKGTRVRVLKEEGGKAQVRDELGNEGWVEKQKLKAK